MTAPEQQRLPMGAAAPLPPGRAHGERPAAVTVTRQLSLEDNWGRHCEELELRHRQQHLLATHHSAGEITAVPVHTSRDPNVGEALSLEGGSFRASGSSHAITEDEYEGIRLSGRSR